MTTQHTRRTRSIRMLFVLILTLIAFYTSFAQNVAINSTGATPVASAMLDITSASKGLLIPRVSLTSTLDVTTIGSPATSLLIYNLATAGTTPNNVIPGYYYWNGSGWVAFSTASNTAWSLSGNTGLTAANFIGTGDDKALIFKSNGASYLQFGRRATLGLTQAAYTDYTDDNEKVTYIQSALQFEAAAASFYKPKMWTDVNGNFRVKGASAGTDYFEFGATGTSNNGGFNFIIGDDGDEPMVFSTMCYNCGAGGTQLVSEIMRLQSGKMAVGSNAFDATNPEKLLIDAGVTTSYNLMTGKGSIDNYLQINVKNSSATANASSDIVASSDNGSETVNFVDMGINSSVYANATYPVLNGANNAYLYAAGNDFVIGNSTASKPLRFFAGGTANTNERIRIDGATGNVGIGETAPNSTLDVNGSISMTFRTGTGNYTILATDYVVIQTNNGSPTWTLTAAAAANSGRIYKLVNHGTGTITLSTAVRTSNAVTTTSLPANTTYEIISDGTDWQKIN